MKFFLFVWILVMPVFCSAQPGPVSLKTNAGDNTLLWEVSGNGLQKPSYLFGTFHLLCRDDIRFSNSLKQSVQNATEVYLELDMDDPSMILSSLTLMTKKGNKKLKDLYTEAEYKRVVDYFKDSMQTPIYLFQTMKPFFLVALLYPKMMPCPTVSSVEDEIMKLAKQNGKEIKGLETMAFQASVFDSIPYEEQAAELLKSIDSMELSKKYFDSMVMAYKEQHINELESLMKNEDFGMESNQDILLDKRNKNWVDQLKTIMKKEPVFVAVGAGHLLGEKGLIALLRKEGYTVRPLDNKQ
jgi:uncharacterized protein YbaP (TraB family)